MSITSDIPTSHEAEQPEHLESESDKRGHRGPERRCIVSRKTAHKQDLIRFVLAPDGTVTPDVLEKLPGRGAYILPDRKTLEKAVETKAFNRAFKGKAIVPDGLADIVSTVLSRRVLGLMTMALKSGRLRVGYDQVRALTQSAELRIRIEALDGSADGRGKLRSLAKAIGRAEHGVSPPVIGCFTALELGQAIGRPPIVHAGVERGKLAKSLQHDMMRLSGFRPLIPLEWADREHEL